MRQLVGRDCAGQICTATGALGHCIAATKAGPTALSTDLDEALPAALVAAALRVALEDPRAVRHLPTDGGPYH
jgi:hypothetical protein